MAPESEASASLPESARLFESDLATDTWLERLREAERPRDLGRLGSYELLEEVGRGRQGIVYRARQPGTGRVIAVKRLLAGSWADEAARLRFAREIEATSALRHPALVTVFEVEHEGDQPLLAMEWIDGLPVNEWARDRSLEEVLEVFLAIADGIRHAHQNGVIHRDLKPANILVDREGRPHVLDFGLARLEEERGEAALQTRSSLFVGTPAYAAPEQVSEGDAPSDALTDLYSLGVVLYEMLTAELPYPLEGGLGAVFRAIETHEPHTPSSKRPGLPREIDAILLKALAKERRQRYQSVDALQADLQRHLAGEPVTAHPPSAWYQLSKLVRRHLAASILAGVILLLVLGFGIAAAIAANRLAHERDVAREATRRALAAEGAAESERAHAESERDRATAVLEYLLRDVLIAANPGSREGEITVSELVELARRALAARFGNRPLDEAAIRSAIGDIFAGMGRLEEAEEEHRRALALRRSALPPDHPAVVQGQQSLAITLLRMGRYREAADLARETIRVLVVDPVRKPLAAAQSYATLARAQIALERLEEAESAYARCLELVKSLGNGSGALRANALAGLATIERSRSRFDAAEKLYRQALALQLDLQVREPLAEALIRQDLAALLLRVDRAEEAEKELAQAWEATVRYLGADHLSALEIKARLASMLRSRGRVREALEVFEETLDGMRRVLPERHPSLIGVLNGIGNALALAGRFEEAESRFREALRLARDAYGEDHGHVAVILTGLARALADSGRQEEAEQLLRRALAIFETAGTDRSAEWLNALSSLGAFAVERGHLDEAESCLQRARDGLAEVLGEDHSSTTSVDVRLALLEERRGHAEIARKKLRAVLARQRRTHSADHVALAETHFHLGRLAWNASAHDEAVKHLQRAVTLGDRLWSVSHTRWLRSRRLLAANLLMLDRRAEARSILTAARDTLSQHLGPADERVRQLETAIAATDE